VYSSNLFTKSEHFQLAIGNLKFAMIISSISNPFPQDRTLDATPSGKKKQKVFASTS
jgi:hypothetical protein